MTLNDFDKYIKKIIPFEGYERDISLNGIQIQNTSPNTKQIKRIAFAVDAVESTVLEASKLKCDVLFVHHGLLWGSCEKIVGHVYKRIAPFIQNDIALYAVHVPLDASLEYGNNIGIARRIDLQNIEPFGQWRGMTLGLKGTLLTPLTIEELQERVLNKQSKPLCVLPFGKKQIQSIGIISGGGASDVETASREGLDAYVTGEFEHTYYHVAKEEEINVLALGHYNSETVGVKLVQKQIQKDFDVETFFIDCPTSL